MKGLQYPDQKVKRYWREFMDIDYAIELMRLLDDAKDDYNLELRMIFKEFVMFKINGRLKEEDVKFLIDCLNRIEVTPLHFE